MRTQLVEATNQNRNWGKFLVGAFDGQEWGHRSSISGSCYPLLMERGWGSDHRLVVDVETGEGALFLPGGLASADLIKRSAIYVTYGDDGRPRPVGGPGLQGIDASADRGRDGMEQVTDESPLDSARDQDKGPTRDPRRSQAADLSILRGDGSSQVLREPQAELQHLSSLQERAGTRTVQSESARRHSDAGREVRTVRLRPLSSRAALPSPRPSREGPRLETAPSEAARADSDGVGEVRSGVRELPRRDPQWLGLGLWVCPLFEPFLAWWWARWPDVDVGTFPPVVQLPDAEFQWSGYRRPGPTEGKLP